MFDRDLVIKKMEKSLPPIVARKEIEFYLGGLYSRNYLANLDSQGLGPISFKVGKNVAYFKEDLISWLSDKLS